MKKSLRESVRQRAGLRCEYCRIHEQDVKEVSFQIEHILPRKHGGVDDAWQLAWSCINCNLSKSSNLAGRDLITGRIVALFNPRRQQWSRHFAWDGGLMVGLTPCGRTTIGVLNINRKRRGDVRIALITAGRFPPPD